MLTTIAAVFIKIIKTVAVVNLILACHHTPNYIVVYLNNFKFDFGYTLMMLGSKVTKSTYKTISFLE